MDASPYPIRGLGRWVCRVGLAGLPLLGVGCVEGAAAWLAPPPTVRAAAPDPGPAPRSESPPVAPPGSPPLLSPLHGGEGREASEPNVVPVSLDTVLRLAEDQNLSVEQARARVDEAVAQQDLAHRYLPELYVGAAYYRHEGGIQNEDGTFTHSSTGAILSGLDIHGKLDPREQAYQRVNAERKSWQQKSELSRITAETLLDAATTYIDLLAAQAAKAIHRELDNDVDDLLKRTEDLAKVEPEARVNARLIRVEVEARRQLKRGLDVQSAAASAKLVHLLGLDPCSKVLPMDGDLVPFDLVDSSRPTCELIEEVQTHGPGVQELASLVSLIEDSIQKAKGPSRFMPSFELHLIEGGFGAGPGANLTWDNRFDAALQVRWSLTELMTRCERQRISDAQRQQAHLAYEELRSKLSAAVREAHETVLGNRGEIDDSRKQIREAEEARKISKERLEQRLANASKDVFDSLKALGEARLNYLSAVRDYDKAQVRLLVLLGCAAPPAQPAPPAPPAPVSKPIEAPGAN